MALTIELGQTGDDHDCLQYYCNIDHITESGIGGD